MEHVCYGRIISYIYAHQKILMHRPFIDDQSFENLDFTITGITAAMYDGCSFSNCKFPNLDLSGFGFSECTFSHCDLSMITCSDTSFKEVRFQSCKLMGIAFHHCNDLLLAFDFEDCIMDYSSFLGMKLKNTSFHECRMQQVDFTNTGLQHTRFNHCDLKDSQFENTNLEFADFSQSYNYNINLEINRVKKTRFSHENIRGLLNHYDIIIE